MTDVECAARLRSLDHGADAINDSVRPVNVAMGACRRNAHSTVVATVGGPGPAPLAGDP